MPSAPSASADPQNGDFIPSRPFTAVVVLGCAFAVLSGVCVLFGWGLGLGVFNAAASSSIAMAPNTALAIAASGLALFLLSRRELHPPARWVGNALAVLVGLIGVVTVAQYLSGVDFGLEALLVPRMERERLQSRVSFSGAISMVCLALSFLLISGRRSKRAADGFACVAGFNGVLSISGYVFGATPSYGIPGFLAASGMALHTAVVMVALSAAALCVRPTEGLMSVVASRHLGGYMARRFLLGAAIIPFFGMLVREGEQAGLYTQALGSSILVALSMAMAVALTLIIANALNAADVERERAVSALEQSRGRYRALFEQASEGIFVADHAGTLMSVNSAGARMLGYSASELVGRKVMDLIDSKDVGRYAAARERMQKGEVVVLEWRAVRKDGEFISVDATSKIIDSGVWQIIARDITERKRRADEQRFLADMSTLMVETLGLQERLEKLARRSVPEIGDWCVVDLVGPTGAVRRTSIIHADPKKQRYADELLSRTPEPIQMESGVTDAMAARQPILMRDIDPKWLAGRTPDSKRHQLLLMLGVRSYVIVPLEARGSVLGTLTFVASARNYSARDLAFAQEIARRAALSADNARLYEFSQRAIRTREDVLAVVSHDLKNPLNAVSAGADLVLKKLLPESGARPEASARIIKVLVNVRRASERASHLIKDLLDFAKIDSGKLRVESRAERVDELLEETRSMMGPIAEDKEVRLTTQSQPNLIARCDKLRIVQVLSNLVGNAIKFNKSGGEVFISARKDASGKLVFAVSDTGPGIAAANVAHIFDRYWQAEDAKKQGTGLGLAIAKGIVEAHGGVIWVQSKVGEGTTIFFTLPMVEPPPLPLEEALNELSDPLHPGS